MNTTEITWEVNGSGQIVGEIEIDRQTYSALWTIEDGAAEISETDADTLPDDEGWPEPPKAIVAEAAKVSAGVQDALEDASE